MGLNYIIHEGDTLQLIAQKSLGDYNYWSDIATLNDLDYPFIVSLTEKTQYAGMKVRVPGDSILLPITDSNDTPGLSDMNVIVMLGSDLDLEGGELGTDAYGDLRLSQGVDCLFQDLKHRLSTPYGTLLGHPEYGSKFTDIIGDRKDNTRTYKACLELDRTFRTDPRVLGVSDITITDMATGIAIDCYITTQMGDFKFSEST